MSPKIIRWGIIGAGKIAKKFAQDLSTLENTTLYGIASRNIEKAHLFASEFNAAKAYGNYEELALDDNVDAIYIATPHSFHCVHTLLCLEHKIPVLCEKPFAMNFHEVDRMIQSAKKNETLLMEAMWTAFLPHFQYICQLIKQKHFGKLLKLEADFGSHPNYDINSRVFDKSVGGGSLLDIGIYPIFAALSTLGVPEDIDAQATFFSDGADSSCDMVFHYDEVKAYLNSSLIQDTATEAVFYFEEGTVKINGRFHQPTSIILIDKSGNSELKTFDYTTIGYSYEIEHFNELIRQGKTESDIMPFDRSISLISTIDRVRGIIGLEYK